VKITEELIDEETMTLLDGCAIDAATLLEMDTASLKSREIIAAIDQCVCQLQKGNGPSVTEEDDPALMLGSLWGQRLIMEFGWTWAAVTFHDHNEMQAIGVFSPDRSLAIYPFHFIWGCLENGEPVAIEMAFNILKDASRIPALPAGGYENVMDHAHAHDELPRD